MIKAVFVDLDGTLLDCGRGQFEPSQCFRRTLDRLRKKGIDFFVATGRSAAHLPSSVRECGFWGYVLANGTSIWLDGQEISRHVLPEELMRRITGQLEEEQVEYALQIPGGTWMSRKREHLLPHFKEYLFDETFLVDRPLSSCLDRVIKMELFTEPQQLQRCLEILHPMDCMYMPQTCTIDAYSREASKGSGIRELQKALGISESDCMCFGDSQNDLQMFASVGWSVAMGNALPTVQRQANDICGKAWEDGVARYLQEHIGGDE